MQVSTNATSPKTICASERVKLIGTIDGRFPDFGHHQELEMGGLWLHPIKLLDGFWLRFHDYTAENTNTWITADSFKIAPHMNEFVSSSGMGHTNVSIRRRQVAPETAAGIVVEYFFKNEGDAPCVGEIEFLAKTDLLPVWFSETGNIFDGEKDTGAWHEAGQYFIAKDSMNEWYTAISSDVKPENVVLGSQEGPEKTHGNGTSVSLFYPIRLEGRQSGTLRFFIAGSFESRQDCVQQLEALKKINAPFEEKQKRYQEIFNKADICVGDKGFEEAYNWVKVNNDWLIADAGKYGRGLSAGIPEYPWWFGCDNCYSLQGVLAMGDYKLSRDTLKLLLDYSIKTNGNGRIVHEITTMGICANPGNTQETAHFVLMMWLYYEWTGDFTLIEEGFDYLQKCVEWLQQQDEDGDGFPSGYGIIEIAGLNSEMIDTAVYTAEAYRCFAEICKTKGLEEQKEKYSKLYSFVKGQINTVLWSEKHGLYCDTCTSIAAVLESKETILRKNKGDTSGTMEQAIEAALLEHAEDGDKETGWLLNHNWVINVPMETGIAPKDKADSALANLHTSKYIDEYGMRLFGVENSPTMTISTGVMAVAQLRYGYADRALELLEKIFSTLGKNTPGCICEMSPDYGCFIQAWTVYAVMVPVVQYMFGIQPQASKNRLVLSPCMPKKWNEARISRVPALDGEVTLAWKAGPESKRYTVSFTGSAPIAVCVPAGKAVRINGVLHEAEGQERYVEAKGEAVVEILE